MSLRSWLAGAVLSSAAAAGSDWNELLATANHLRDTDGTGVESAYQRALSAARQETREGLAVIAVANDFTVYLIRQARYGEVREILRPQVAACLATTRPVRLCGPALHNSGLAHQALGEMTVGVDLMQAAVHSIEATEGPKSPLLSASISTLGIALVSMGRLNEAESILRRSTSPDAKVYIALSEISRQRKRYAEAHLFAAKALRLTRVAAVSPDGASAEAGARYQLACVEWAEGDLAGAARNLESALSVLDARGSVDALNTVTIISALGLLKLQTGKLSEARALLQRAKDLANRGGDRPALALVLHRSAAVAERAKDLPSAEALLRQSLLLGDEIWGIHSSQSALCVADLVRILVQQRKFSDAELLSRRVDATHSSGAEPAWIPVLALRVKLLSKLKRKEEAALIGSRLKTILSAYPTQAAQQVDIIEMFRSVP